MSTKYLIFPWWDSWILTFPSGFPWAAFLLDAPISCIHSPDLPRPAPAPSPPHTSVDSRCTFPSICFICSQCDPDALYFLPGKWEIFISHPLCAIFLLWCPSLWIFPHCATGTHGFLPPGTDVYTSFTFCFLITVVLCALAHLFTSPAAWLCYPFSLHASIFFKRERSFSGFRRGRDVSISPSISDLILMHTVGFYSLVLCLSYSSLSQQEYVVLCLSLEKDSGVIICLLLYIHYCIK